MILIALRQKESTGPPSEISNIISEEVERMSASKLSIAADSSEIDPVLSYGDSGDSSGHGYVFAPRHS